MANIIISGDSITWGAWDTKGGWVQRLREYFKINLHGEVENIIYNLGISGDNSNDLVERFNQEVSRRIDPEEKNIIIIAIGINDSQYLINEEENRINPSIFSRNIDLLIHSAKSITKDLILVGLTLVDESKTNPIIWNSNKSYSNSYIKEYNEIIKQCCARNNASFINLIPEIEKVEFNNFLDDGLHPDDKGHKLICDIILPEVIHLLEIKKN